MSTVEKPEMCQVCCEDFSLSRKKVTCLFCQYDVCQSCAQTYMMDVESKRDPQCMSCHTEWNRLFLLDNFTQSFCFKTWKNFREEVLFERQKALLPEALPHAERRQLILDMTRNISSKRELYYQLKKELSEDEATLYHLRHDIHQTGWGAPAERKLFIKGCPVTDCRGFLSSQYVCALCNVRMCAQCWQIKTSNVDHECDPSDIATAQLIRANTKPCPDCGTPISKVDGCDQMWSPCCKIFFSWATGRKTQGTPHNPEYYRWLRENPDMKHPIVIDEKKDIGNCGVVMPHLREITRISRSHPENLYLLDVHRLICHVDFSIIGPHHRRTQHQEDVELKSRVRYLLKEITEEAFKRKLQKDEKSQFKQQQTVYVMETFKTLVTEILHDLARDYQLRNTNLEILLRNAKLNNIRVFTNKGLLQIQQYFKCTGPQITEKWTLVQNNKH